MSKVIDLTGKPQSEWYSNPNLLDNWYFADPIDQRQGYVVPPETPYYSDTGLSAQAGTAAAYTTAKYVDGVYGSVTVNGAMYYVDWTAAVRGYVGSGYTADRWKIVSNGNSIPTLINDTHATVKKTVANEYGQFSQIIGNVKYLAGRTVTLSALIRSTTTPFLLVFPNNSEDGSGVVNAATSSTEWTLVSATRTLNFEFTNLRYAIGYQTQTAIGNIDIKAVKLELGDTQTLAHQNENGEWVLNDPPPNRALELAKCQRYYQLFSSADAYPENLADYRPAMRANPALGTININGQTMYFADANL